MALPRDYSALRASPLRGRPAADRRCCAASSSPCYSLESVEELRHGAVAARVLKYTFGASRTVSLLGFVIVGRSQPTASCCASFHVSTLTPSDRAGSLDASRGEVLGSKAGLPA
jgi:hypothetical protein